ncbi:adenosine kinase [Limnohabitans sp. 63ED37-2]|uniref:adenosine kinase n=1 Tax=Limnohabitans sp. 63ED37-2 TaxID=1678128 RepID=UPI000706692D|nr:adenosine kinase [Limnohabitans sp. 63ED37-2]ALK87918.1 2-dehydro-3-deoxygluconokinase [Limnohabitans sp. 63ED37-2]
MSHYHLYAIGNALVDTEYEVSDELLSAMGVSKRHMTLIDTPQRAELLKHVQSLHARRTGGGSAGNTVVALAQLGGQAFYSCRVADDELGAYYTQDLQTNGVATNLTHTRPTEGQTGSCMVLVTPDAERSMCTFLGATSQLDVSALHPQDIAKSKIYYMEGYLAASPTGLEAAVKGRQMAVEHQVQTALTLSDVSMINFCKAGLEAMLGDGLDYLFANEEEAQTWCGTKDLDAILAQLSPLAKTVCLTRGPQGCIVLQGQSRTDVPAVPAQAVDTNGAGDMFAGTFLYGITHGHTPAQSAALANRTAAAVVSQHGNRLTQAQMQGIYTDFCNAQG